MRQHSSSDDILNFAVGCIYFETEPDDLDQWPEYVLEALEGMPDVSDIEVEAAVDDGAITFEGKACPISASTRFKISISESDQEVLLSEAVGEYRARAIAESFEVITHYLYYGPVTFIVLEQPTGLGDSSDAPVVVREYLDRSLKETLGHVASRTMGPSPFHAKFTLRLEERDDVFELDRTARRGYDDFSFWCSTEFFSSLGEAANALFDEIGDELSFFYSLQRDRSDRIDATSEINRLSGNLIAVYEDTRLSARLKRLFVSSAKTRYLALKAIVAEYNMQGKHSALPGLAGALSRACVIWRHAGCTGGACFVIMDVLILGRGRV